MFMKPTQYGALPVPDQNALVEHRVRELGEAPSKPNLIRVLVLMPKEYCEANNSDRLAKKQLNPMDPNIVQEGT